MQRARRCVACAKAGSGKYIPSCDKLEPKCTRCQTLGIECVEEEKLDHSVRLTKTQRAKMAKERAQKTVATKRRLKAERAAAIDVEQQVDAEAEEQLAIKLETGAGEIKLEEEETVGLRGSV